MSSSLNVCFVDTKSAYPPNVEITVIFKIGKDYSRSRRDWVGIFRVGFSSSRDYYTFQWVPEVPVPEDKDEVEVKVTYPARSIPASDGYFYQFAYVSASSGNIVTVSETFYIGTPLSHDPEFIEIPSSEGMESMLMIATSPEKIATSPEIAGLRENVSALEEQLKKVKSERDQFVGVVDSLKGQLSACESDKVKLQESLDALVESRERLSQRNDELEEMRKTQQDESLDKDVQIEALRRDFEEFNAQAKEKLMATESELSRVKVENATLLEQIAAVGEYKSEMTALRLQLDQQKMDIEEMNFKLIEENKELKDQFQKKQSEVDGLIGAKMFLEEELGSTKHKLKDSEETVTVLMRNQGQLEELAVELGEKRRELGDLQVENNELKEIITKLGEDLEKKDKNLTKMSEELTMAQSNIAELMGAPPRDRPVVRADGVDPVAHDALLRTVEKVQEDKRALSEDCSGLRTQVEALKQREADLVVKLEQCTEEYRKKATETVELNKQMKKMKLAEEGAQTLVVSVKESAALKEENRQLMEQITSARSDIERLKNQLAEIQQSEDLALGELTNRRKEIEELKKELLVKDNEIMLIEQRTDTKIHDKNGEIQRLTEVVQRLEEQIREARMSVESERTNAVNLTEALRLREESLDATKHELEHVRSEAETDRKTIVDLKEALRLNEDSIRARQPPVQPPVQPVQPPYPVASGPYMPPPEPGAIRYPPGHQPTAPPQPVAHPQVQQPHPQVQQPRPQAPQPHPTPAGMGHCPVCQHLFPHGDLQHHVNSHFTN